MPEKISDSETKVSWRIAGTRILLTLRDRIESVRPQSKMFFIHHLRVMTTAGLSLHDALETLAEEITEKHFRRVIEAVADSVERGNALAESMEHYPKVFPEIFTNMIRAGEKSGKLESVLEELYTELEKDHTLRSKVRGALIYPTVIIIVMIGIGIFMMTVVLPRLISIFDQIQGTLPLPTRMVIAMSAFVTTHGLITVAILITVVVLTTSILRTKRGRAFFDATLLRTPIIGGIAKKINLARATRTLSSLLKTDIPFAQSLSITGSVLGNIHYRTAFMRAAGQVETGVTLEELLRHDPRLFPPLVRQMVSVGERTGSLDDTLGNIASFYEQEVTTTMENLPALIEPILIVVLGLGVGGLAVAVIMPMYSLTQQF